MPLCNSMILLVQFLCLLTVTGCNWGRPDWLTPVRNPEYSFGFYNATKGDLDYVKAEWQAVGHPWRAGGGHVSSGIGATDAFEPDPIPDRVTLSWTTPDGIAHKRDVAVASKVDNINHFTGTIWIKFVDLTDDGFRVIPMTKAETDSLAWQHKSIYP